jgi:4-diphosphocytidyl-2-C-methyl-D-erythritol kinase
MVLEVVAPAKLNLTLEVTGRRADGYHEIVSLMQTVDLADTVRLSEAGAIEVAVSGEELRGVPQEGPRNLAYRAAQALAEEAGDADLGALIELEKRIPVGMGLGGGSTDAAATLRGLNQLWHLGMDELRLAAVAARVGSDVAFFLKGGTALATGRGEVIEALPDAEALEFTLFVSPIEIEDKTRRMYAMLTPADFLSGHHTRVTAESLRRGLPLSDSDLVNPFERYISEVAEPMSHAMRLCRDAGLAVSVTGSGPGFYTCLPLGEVPGLLLRELEREWDVTAVGCRSLGRSGATAVSEP